MSRYLHEVAGRLVSFDTVSSKSNAEAMEYLGAHFDDQGFRVTLQRTEVASVPKINLIACAGPAEPDGFIISGHVDTVPFTGQPGWTHDPLQLEIDDSRVYGRGTSDMKVFLAQCLDAAAQLDLATLRRPLVFLFTADEEVGCLGAERMLPILPESLGGIPQPRLAWIGEPTSYQVFHTHKGVVLFRVTVRGLGGHSSIPEQGVNAIAVAGKAIETIGRYQAELRAQRAAGFAEIFPESPYTTLNFGGIRGGVFTSKSPAGDSAARKPCACSSASGVAAMPAAAKRAAYMPEAAALPGCVGLTMDPKLDMTPLASETAAPSACAAFAGLSRCKDAHAAAAPTAPNIPVGCQPFR